MSNLIVNKVPVRVHSHVEGQWLVDIDGERVPAMWPTRSTALGGAETEVRRKGLVYLALSRFPDDRAMAQVQGVGTRHELSTWVGFEIYGPVRPQGLPPVGGTVCPK